MTTFLRETLEFWYWAIFCPGKLQARLNEWVPLDQVEQFEPPPDPKKSKKDKEKNEEGDKKKVEDVKPTSSTFADVFWFRAKSTTRANRLLAQYILLVAVSTLPLSILATAFAGPQGLILGAGVALMALGLGPFSQSLGLLTPILCAWMYLWSPSRVHDRLHDIATALLSLHRFGLACCASVAVLGLSGLVAEHFWKRRSLRLWRLFTFVGVIGSVSVGAGIITEFGFAVMVVLYGSILLLLAADRDGYIRHRFVAGWLLPTIIALLLSFLLLASEQQSYQGILNWVSLVFAGMFITLGIIGVISHGFSRIFGGRLIGSLLAGAIAGVAGTLTATVAGAFFLATLTTSPFSYLLVVSWSFGHAMAIPRENNFIIGIAWPLALSFNHGWWALLTLPATLVGYWRLFPDYPLLACASAVRARRIRTTQPETLVQWLHTLPPYQHECITLPVYRHADLLVAAFRVDPSSTLDILKRASASDSIALKTSIDDAWPGFTKVVKSWASKERGRLLRARLRAAANADDLLAVGHDGDLSVRILEPDELPASEVAAPDNFNGNVAADITELLPLLKNVAHDAGTALAQDLPVQRERGLERCLSSLEQIRGRIAELDLAIESANGWMEVVEHWQVILREAIETHVSAVPRPELIQPFQSGTPLRPERAHLFKGRERLAEDIVQRAHGPSRPPLVLHGPRRCGKSSLLLNLSRLVPDDLLPVYVDLQNQAMMNSEGDFCYGLVRAATRDLHKKISDLPIADRATFQANPYPALEDWLDALSLMLKEQRILLCFDEFEKLGEAMTRGRIGEPLFDELRHMIQHREELSFVFCGAQTLDELGPKWTSYFINARPVEILYLEPNEARELLEDPDPAFDLKYEPGVVDRILELTRCQPYLLQLIGEAMVIVAQRHDVRWIDELLLDEALDGALSAGEIYFSDLWKETTGTTPEEVAAGQTVLRLVANDGNLPTTMGEHTQSALNRLLRYHVVAKRDGVYSIEIPLIARWIREQKGIPGLPS